VDVTDRRNNELQAAALQEELAHRGRLTMIEALTGSIAHEINQPLTAVMANAEAASRMMALASPPLAALREILDDILRDNQRAGDVVRRMRTLLEKRATVSEPVEVNGSVTEVVKLIQGNAATRRIALEVDLATRIEPVSADRIQFQQVVLNLVLNAFDAVQDVDASDRRVALRTSQRNRTATIEVRDQGTGLSDEAMARMFEPFFTTKRDGMGLGLWICRAIVSAHCGTLEASRNPLRGMTFSASFPVWNAGRRVARASRSGREVHVP
jgi:two-component system, LuxR family, sensor kinase FixL